MRQLFHVLVWYAGVFCTNTYSAYWRNEVVFFLVDPPFWENEIVAPGRKHNITIPNLTPRKKKKIRLKN